MKVSLKFSRDFSVSSCFDITRTENVESPGRPPDKWNNFDHYSIVLMLCVLSAYLLLKYVPTVPFFALCAIPAIIGTGIIAAYSFFARVKKEEGRLCEKSNS